MVKEKTAEKKTVKQKEAESQTAIRAVGRRKEAIARVRLQPGSGAFLVNDKDFKEYFPYTELQRVVQSALTLVNLRNTFDISVKVIGGGIRGQAESVRHGITRCLLTYNLELKKTLRGAGFVTRDPRVKERKKPGLKRARRAPQFSKR